MFFFKNITYIKLHFSYLTYVHLQFGMPNNQRKRYEYVGLMETITYFLNYFLYFKYLIFSALCQFGF